jgi:hypothetical protein
MVVVPLIWIRETWEELVIVQLNAYLQAWLAPSASYPLAEAVFAEQIPGAKWFRDITI